MEDERKERGGCAVLVGIAVALLPVLYLLGVGPAYWLTIHGILPESLTNGLYYPLHCLDRWSPAFHDLLVWYLSFWAW